MPVTVHSIEEIEALLRRGATPKTDNVDALLKLGFERASPLAQSGHDQTVWERSVDRAERATNGLRVMIRERAILERSGSLN